MHLALELLTSPPKDKNSNTQHRKLAIPSTQWPWKSLNSWSYQVGHTHKYHVDREVVIPPKYTYIHEKSPHSAEQKKKSRQSKNSFSAFLLRGRW